ncbi:MAG: alpha-ketoglutarate-dependent dioxygenase AlkB [bacterium]
MLADFQTHRLDDTHVVHLGALPPALRVDADAFERLWALHPADKHEIHLHGRRVETPRWQQAYGADYHYTGRTNHALPLTDEMAPLLDWCRQAIDPRLDGLLFNWYDAAAKHYIGKHRDSIKHMVEGAPIVTVSLGAPRTFRLRPYRQAGMVDLDARDGSVIVIPWATNRGWTHEVPHFARDTGRRISITARAFEAARP